MLDASANRATLSLERPYKDEAGQVIPTLLDITPDGHHVHEPVKDPVETLGENLRRVFLERGSDFFDKNPSISSSLEAQGNAIAANEDEAGDVSDSDEDGDSLMNPMTAEDLLNMRIQILPQLFIALGEISHARDLLSVLLSSTSSASDLALPALPSSTLSATVVTKPPPIPSVHAFDAQLAVGGKDESLRKAASLLKSAAGSMERGRAESETYWVDALKIRRANWGLTPAPLPFGAPIGRGADKNCTDFLISYGLEESPPIFRRRAIGRLPTHNTATDIITFPYRQRTRLRVTLAPMQLTAPEEICHSRSFITDPTTPDGALQAAQREVVEQEIFSMLIREAGNLPTASARVSEQLIVIEAAQNTELRFELVASEETDKPATAKRHDTGSAKCDLIYSLLQLLLLRSHTYARAERLSNTAIVRAASIVAQPPPILQPIIDLLQYEVFCDRVHAEITKVATALSEAGVPAKVRFNAVGDTGEHLVRILSEEGINKIGGQVILRIDGSHTIRFTLLSPSSLTAHLPQATLAVSSIPQLCQLLSDEVERCLLSRICDVGRELCESVSGTWFVDSLAGRSIGKWEGAALDFRISFGENGRVLCSVIRMIRGQDIASTHDQYAQGTGEALFAWVHREIESVTSPPTTCALQV